MNERAYYNENDEFAAAWLRNVIDKGLVAPGEVDTRSVVDVRSDDLIGFRQCHFFAGIGVWSYALRLAGWPDDRHVWSGSCPCGPFSGAGQKLGLDDERHLWPEFYRLIGESNPRIILGEQVASPLGLAWLDIVQADLENAGYASAAIDLCAAGFGAPHIRQRLYWVAYASRESIRAGLRDLESSGIRGLEPTNLGAARLLVDGLGARLEGYTGDGDGAAGRQIADRSIAEAGSARELASIGHNDRPSAVNGHWRNADWLFCRDGRWRPVEPGTFPLAHGTPARVGRLRGYGNAVVAQVAKEFIEAVMEVIP